MSKAETVFEKMGNTINTLRQLQKTLSSKGGLTIGTKEGKELIKKFNVTGAKARNLTDKKKLKIRYGLK